MNSLEAIADQKSVKRWFSNLPNPNTRRVYLPELKRFACFAARSPDELVDLGLKNGEEAHNLLKMFYNSLTFASHTKMKAY